MINKKDENSQHRKKKGKIKEGFPVPPSLIAELLNKKNKKSKKRKASAERTWYRNNGIVTIVPKTHIREEGFSLSKGFYGLVSRDKPNTQRAHSFYTITTRKLSCRGSCTLPSTQQQSYFFFQVLAPCGANKTRVLRKSTQHDEHDQTQSVTFEPLDRSSLRAQDSLQNSPFKSSFCTCIYDR